MLDKFWQLLEFNSDGQGAGDSADQDDDHTGRSDNKLSGTGYVFKQESSEEHFANLLRRKFTLFKSLTLEMLNESEKVLKFTVEEIKRIADYAKDSYFRHLRLYDYVLNNKQLCEVKRITIQFNEPVVSSNLNDALLLGSEELLGYEDEDEELRLDIIHKKQELA